MKIRLPEGAAMSHGAAKVTKLTTEMCSDPGLPAFK